MSKIALNTNLNAARPLDSATRIPADSAPKVSATSQNSTGFKEILTATLALEGEVKTMRGTLSTKKTLNPRELLYYQVRIGEYGLTVELLSKTAESALTTLRKLQNPQ